MCISDSASLPTAWECQKCYLFQGILQTFIAEICNCAHFQETVIFLMLFFAVGYHSWTWNATVYKLKLHEDAQKSKGSIHSTSPIIVLQAVGKLSTWNGGSLSLQVQFSKAQSISVFTTSIFHFHGNVSAESFCMTYWSPNCNISILATFLRC